MADIGVDRLPSVPGRSVLPPYMTFLSPGPTGTGATFSRTRRVPAVTVLTDAVEPAHLDVPASPVNRPTARSASEKS
jgi:hypothetical protein